ncbi:heterokaryon incompatibility protein-domain-containing protein [Xylariaceae sp. FL0016]|nr:heterokaryon incompatibility protein-domain-containing protein [Xylariaceae sp. FL0016]
MSPTRLIDVGNGAESLLRIVITDGARQYKYIALSHRWVTENEACSLTSDNIHTYTNREGAGIRLEQLPKTFQDAVTITRGLGIQYLWIDSLCIIQKDKADWELEAGRMESVFSGAYCTIAASSTDTDGVGFLGDRKPRPCIALELQHRRLYLCKAIDNFQRDVEEIVLNRRGWVLQERALSQRTTHFTSHQIYWECGEGIHCETLSKLKHSKSQILGDADFPNSALKYYRDDRIESFQLLYGMYSRRDFTKPTDRSMGLLGLERRLARTFKTEGEFGILKRYVQRSLLWERQPAVHLKPITYRKNQRVPSWSWMAYTGGITYLKPHFGSVSWKDDSIRLKFGTIPSSDTTQTRGERLPPAMEALSSLISTSFDLIGIKTRVSLDQGPIEDSMWSSLRCVILGSDKDHDKSESTHYAMIIRPIQSDSERHIYRRFGVGSLLDSHISKGAGEWVWIR